MCAWRQQCLPVETLVASAIRSSIGFAAIAAEPIATSIHPLLGKIAHAGGILFVMLALWSILLPIESAIITPIARAIAGRLGRRSEP